MWRRRGREPDGPLSGTTAAAEEEAAACPMNRQPAGPFSGTTAAALGGGVRHDKGIGGMVALLGLVGADACLAFGSTKGYDGTPAPPASKPTSSWPSGQPIKPSWIAATGKSSIALPVATHLSRRRYSWSPKLHGVRISARRSW